MDDDMDPRSGDLLAALNERLAGVRRLVPDCVGITLAVEGSTGEGVYTVVASDLPAALLDAVQYLDDGPCLTTDRAETPLAFDRPEFLAEPRWEAFAAVSAQLHVEATLTLPILSADAMVGTVNLYAATPGAFAGRHHAVAQVFAGWAPDVARQASQALREAVPPRDAPGEEAPAEVERATRLVASRLDVDVVEASAYLREAARRAGVPIGRLATVLLSLTEMD